jgi:hypothetical protein
MIRSEQAHVSLGARAMHGLEAMSLLFAWVQQQQVRVLSALVRDLEVPVDECLV